MPGGSGRNNELQFAGTYGETGVRYMLALPAGDMDARSRQVRHPARLGPARSRKQRFPRRSMHARFTSSSHALCLEWLGTRQPAGITRADLARDV